MQTTRGSTNEPAQPLPIRARAVSGKPMATYRTGDNRRRGPAGRDFPSHGIIGVLAAAVGWGVAGILLASLFLVLLGAEVGS